MRSQEDNNRPKASQAKPAPSSVPGHRSLAPHVRNALTAAAQPKMPGSLPGLVAPARHVQAALNPSVQARPQDRAGRPGAPAPHVQAAIGVRAPVAPLPRSRPPVLQRMEVAKPVLKSSPEPLRFQGNGGELLTIADSGSRYDAMINGKSVGYLTYGEETEEGKRRMRFGYIHITNSAYKGKKLSALLVAVLALEALNRGILILCVGHPDPTLKAYWEAMGFDFHGEQQRQYKHRQELYKDQDIGSVDDVTVTEAEGRVPTALRWAQQSYRSYWQPL